MFLLNHRSNAWHATWEYCTIYEAGLYDIRIKILRSILRGEGICATAGLPPQLPEGLPQHAALRGDGWDGEFILRATHTSRPCPWQKDGTGGGNTKKQKKIV